MVIKSKVEQRHQTAHPSLEIVSVIYYCASILGNDVDVFEAWVYPEYATPDTIDLCVNKGKAGNWKILELITNDARKKAYQINNGAPNNADNSQESAYYEYNP